VHVTVRASHRVGSLRRARVVRAIVARLRVVAQADRFAARREVFRVVHFSVQPDHLHLIVEASEGELSSGLQGLLGPLARAVNRTLGRRGRLFTTRYHAHVLATPREVRNAIVYVLKNAAKHPEWEPDAGTHVVRGIDPCSSARWFSGWARPPEPPDRAPPTADARTWLLSRGWRRHGALGRGEVPRT
jgi:REP element-mobilizing transposase RayT